MKIAAVDTLIVDGGRRNWVFVTVVTEDGLQGLGEATLEGRAEAAAACVSELRRSLIGADARRIQHLWQVMYRHAFYRGGPAMTSAVSGVEQALWDLKGKALGVPVYELLGGACRDRLRVYANGPRGKSPEEYATSACAIRAAGFNAMKVAPLEATMPVDDGATIRRAADCVRAIRDAVGPSVAIAVDVHGRLSPAMSIQFAHRIEDLDIWFIEEPSLPENPRAMAQVARATHIPVATGERLFTKFGFREVLELGAAALLQPDVSHCGGIQEARFIAAMAEVCYAGFAPHNPLSPVNTAASAQVAMASPNFVALEWVFDDVPWRDQLLTEPLAIRDGWLTLPARPGLGIDLDFEVCRAHPYNPVNLGAMWHEDGSVADW